MHFKFTYSSYFGFDYTFTLNNNELKITTRFDRLKETKQLSNVRVLTFWNRIKTLEIETWKDEYDDNDICDGLQWGVDVRTYFLTKTIFGSNEFPDGCYVSKTPIFNELLSAVEYLIDDDGFFDRL